MFVSYNLNFTRNISYVEVTMYGDPRNEVLVRFISKIRYAKGQLVGWKWSVSVAFGIPLEHLQR